MEFLHLKNNERRLTSSFAAAKEFLYILLPFTFLLVVIVTAHYSSVSRTEKAKLDASEMLNVGLARSALNSDLATGLTDLRFLTNYFTNQGFDLYGQIQQEEMESLLLEFAQQKRLYHQIRFIDINGDEKIRINFNQGTANVVPKKELQNKKDRYYFVDAMKLAHNAVYISRLDLNIENDEIEYPLKPVIRFAMPVFLSGSEKKGILILNYLGDRMLENFIRNTANIADHIHLVNEDGYWLHGPVNADAWGFMLPHKRRFSSDFSQEWDAIKKTRAGQYRTDNGLFSYETVTPLSVAAQALSGMTFDSMKKTERWYIVSRVSPEKDSPGLWHFLVKNFPVYLLMLVLIMIGSWLLAMTRLKHRRAEMVSEYERLFRQTLENLTLLAVAVDNDGTVHFCNNALLKLTGWQLEDVLNNNWTDHFVAPENKRQVKETFERLKLDKEFPEELETELATRQGETRLVAWHNTLAFDGNGQITGITSVGEDITEKRQNEQQIKKLSRAVEQSPSIVMLTDRHGWIEYVNPKFTEVTGYQAEEVIGFNPKILKSGETTESDYKSLWETLNSGKVWRGEFHNRKKNGELYWESAAISALRNENDVVTNYIAVKEDITEQKRLQAEVAHQQQELARHQALTAMGRMAGEIAHDLRNPLSSVKMSLQILGRQAQGEQRELKDIGLGQVRYMENILADMLTYARPATVKSELVDLIDLLENIFKSHLEVLSTANIKLAFNVGIDVPMIAGDPDKLRRMFNNLISNAIKAMDDETIKNRTLSVRISFTKTEKAGEIKIEICDNGVGLGDTETERLFEPFYTTHAQGTGLGLAIVRQIAEQHQGTVELTQSSDQLTCFTVRLPLDPNEFKKQSYLVNTASSTISG